MPYYFISGPNAENPDRWIYSTDVNSTDAILQALRRAGFKTDHLQTTASITPYLSELAITKRGATREAIERVIEAADPAVKIVPAAAKRGIPHR